jgi:glycine C-acetyltransferase
MFGSNDYLGLAGDDRVVDAAIDAMRTYGAGLGMNQPFATTPLHERLREVVAAFHGTESALLFGSCTAANIALLTTLGASPADLILSDAANHASIVDGCRLARAQTAIYRPRDMADANRLVDEADRQAGVTIVSDGVFSIEGELAPARHLAAIADRVGAILVIDESHAAGVVGHTGRGTAEVCGIDMHDARRAITGTFSKAFGAGGGGYVAGSLALINELRHAARFYVFSTGMHVAAVGAALEAIRIASSEPDRRVRLHHNARHLRARLSSIGIDVALRPSPITPILIGSERRAIELSARLSRRGIYIPAMTYPVVPRGEAVLRAQPSAGHHVDAVDRLCDALSAELVSIGDAGDLVQPPPTASGRRSPARPRSQG